MVRRHRRRWTALAQSLLILLAACGGATSTDAERSSERLAAELEPGHRLPLRPIRNVPACASVVSTRPGDRRLYVRRARPDCSLEPEIALVVRGVAWSPTSAGDDPAANPLIFQQRFIDWAATDIPRMQDLRVNTVRVYHDFGTGPAATQLLDAFYRAGIWVIMEVGSPRHGANGDLSNIDPVVSAHRNHPAILMWSFGNEWDINGFGLPNETLTTAAQHVNTAAAAIKSLDPNHPVTTFIGDVHIRHDITGILYKHPLDAETAPFYAGPFTSTLVNALAPAVDVWSTNLYRGQSFGDAFAQWRRVSTKPLLIGEFGIDRYDHRIGAESPAMQAAALAHLLNEIHFELSAERTAGTVIGGIVFSLVDEHWKNGTPGAQQPTSEPNPGQPDGFNDEEYFGILNILRSNAAGAAYLEIQRRFMSGAQAVTLAATPVVTVRSSRTAELDIDGRPVFGREGGAGGARGFNVLVIDRHTGNRLADSAHFDSWHANQFGAAATRFDGLIDYLGGIPPGAIVAVVIADHGAVGADTPSQRLRSEMAANGATQFNNVDFSTDRYALLFVKGGPVLAERFANDDGSVGNTVTASITATLSLMPNEAAGRR